MRFLRSTAFWQSIAAVVAPAVTGGLALALLFGATGWISGLDLIGRLENWTWIPLSLAWLLVWPLLGALMGIGHVFCLRQLQLPTDHARNLGRFCLALFYLLPSPILVVLVFFTCGLVLLPLYVHLAYFDWGQKRGQKWIEDGALEEFLGLSNRWERRASNSDDS